MQTEQTKQAPRARLIAEAAIAVLGKKGAAGLTHRAVDREAGLAEGSTSNVFRTRAALVSAICRCLTERDLSQLRDMSEGLSSTTGMNLEGACAAVAGIVRLWAEDDATHTCARLELFLAARRDPEIAGSLAEARTAFHAFGSDWLERLSPGSSQHLASLMAVIEGLTMNQLLHPSSRLSPAELESEVSLLLRAIIRTGEKGMD